VVVALEHLPERALAEDFEHLGVFKRNEVKFEHEIWFRVLLNSHFFKCEFTNFHFFLHRYRRQTTLKIASHGLYS
jgi:hypothetical protein